MIVTVNGFRCGLHGDGPYTARSASDKTDDWPYWYVAGPDGRRNVLYFPDKPGAVFTDKETALAIVHAVTQESHQKLPARSPIDG